MTRTVTAKSISISTRKERQEIKEDAVALTAVFREPVGHGEAACTCSNDHIVVAAGNIPLATMNAFKRCCIGDCEQQSSRKLLGDHHRDSEWEVKISILSQERVTRGRIFKLGKMRDCLLSQNEDLPKLLIKATVGTCELFVMRGQILNTIALAPVS